MKSTSEKPAMYVEFYAPELWRGDLKRKVEIVPVGGISTDFNLWEACPNDQERPMGCVRLKKGKWVADYIDEKGHYPQFVSLIEAVMAMYKNTYRKYVHPNHEPLKEGATCIHCGEQVTLPEIRCKARW